MYSYCVHDSKNKYIIKLTYILTAKQRKLRWVIWIKNIVSYRMLANIGLRNCFSINRKHWYESWPLITHTLYLWYFIFVLTNLQPYIKYNCWWAKWIIYIRCYYILSSNKGILVWPIWPEVNCLYFNTPGK